jgi:hypothetical protein
MSVPAVILLTLKSQARSGIDMLSCRYRFSQETADKAKAAADRLMDKKPEIFRMSGTEQEAGTWYAQHAGMICFILLCKFMEVQHPKFEDAFPPPLDKASMIDLESIVLEALDFDLDPSGA